ncbi:MAG: hypothetical protein A2831_02850 [Candidatus Yanofskybacteria bacterium RIFCSPHIGHO2_01_FULL_44_17]|uniref:Uncharacterized protein n=1 Tax=Candidatus Yanofskybacteria bacterium RIFCSPHIGHO2_01_FULL_44_17 TaxID=1802668 RepID=A0A1F8EVV5_9BACT|nr:MAG: hypothetical protein A2831_02850 [Candidatus Yanofskybacteria bacterium RIFCSPHIGHO2_01_FULL_44_17]
MSYFYQKMQQKSKNARRHFLMARAKGLGFDSHLTVVRFGLATASRFGLLAKYRSGVRFPSPSTI